MISVNSIIYLYIFNHSLAYLLKYVQVTYYFEKPYQVGCPGLVAVSVGEAYLTTHHCHHHNTYYHQCQSVGKVRNLDICWSMRQQRENVHAH